MKKKINRYLIYQPSSLPSFVTFDAVYFCLWPKTLSFERYMEEKPWQPNTVIYHWQRFRNAKEIKECTLFLYLA